jgi:protein-tyrosine phosphatase
MTMPIRVLMVCLGNICRSPTAEAVFRATVQAAGLEQGIEVDSAGTSDWHCGDAPDPRSIRHAARRDYDLSTLRARQVQAVDFESFHYIMAMDRQNLRDLQARCPTQYSHKLGLFLQHADSPLQEVPDPYDYGPEQFEQVLDLVEEASRGLLDFLLQQHPQLGARATVAGSSAGTAS